MTWRPRDSRPVRIVCAPRHEGTVCRAAGGCYPQNARVAFVYLDRAWVVGVHRWFSRRANGKWVMRGFDQANGPRLEAP